LQLVTARHSWNFIDNTCYRPVSAPSHFHLFGSLTKQSLAKRTCKRRRREANSYLTTRSYHRLLLCWKTRPGATAEEMLKY
jgi:hypothetical protein